MFKKKRILTTVLCLIRMCLRTTLTPNLSMNKLIKFVTSGGNLGVQSPNKQSRQIVILLKDE